LLEFPFAIAAINAPAHRNGVPLPLCGQCCRPVERLELEPGTHVDGAGGSSLRVVARCHGAVQSVLVPLELIERLAAGDGGAAIHLGIAFA
jgi:hypothetical protein